MTKRLYILLCSVLVMVIPKFSIARDFVLTTQYENRWFFDASSTNVSTPLGGPYADYFGTYPNPAISNASTVCYHGNVGPYTDGTNFFATVTPANSEFMLPLSSFGQPVEGVRPDVTLGAPITPPEGANTNIPPDGFTAVRVGNNPNAYYKSPSGAAFWVPSTGRIIAAQPNNIKIDWVMNDGTTNTQVYMASAVPASRPARIFWTESPYDAPTVNLDGLFPVIHYNSEIPEPEYQVSTNVYGNGTNIVTNIVSGVWIDDQKRMHAVGVSGMFLLEYYKTGNYKEQVQPVGIEVVEVLPPQVSTLDVAIGERVLPRDSFWGTVEGKNGLIADIKKGIHEFLYLYSNDKSEKDGWVWAIKKSVDNPYSVEIYWEHHGLMDVRWPYEVDWYRIDWPEQAQQVAFSDNQDATAATLLPHELSATVMPYQEPPLHLAVGEGGRSFKATAAGFGLMKYATASDIWFEVIKSVRHDDFTIFNPAPIPWKIGKEITPLGDATHALRFEPASTNYVSIGESFLNKEGNWSFSAWIKPLSDEAACIYSEGDPSDIFEISIAANGMLHVGAKNRDYSGNWMHFYTPSNVVQIGKWQFVAVSMHNAAIGSGELEVCINDNNYTGTLQRVSAIHADRAVIGAVSGNEMATLFDGLIEQVNIWNKHIPVSVIWSNRYVQYSGKERYLAGDFTFDEGSRAHIENYAGVRDGTVNGVPHWEYGFRLPDMSRNEWPEFPGYIYKPTGTAYNINRYNYPTEADPEANSYIFPINKGKLEIWWAHKSKLKNLPVPIYYPDEVQIYTNSWPTNYDEIVIASGNGSGGWLAWEPEIYYQNDPSADGYNPNEEHSLIIDGKIYALRNDLNESWSSEPFTLVDYLNTKISHPEMKLFHVVATNAEYSFDYDVKAGVAVVPPMPVGVMPLCSNTYSSSGPAWEDRKLGWWAKAAGDDGGATNIVMHFYYFMQEGFDFPEKALDEMPAPGTEIAWLPNPSHEQGASGKPVAMNYHVTWPDVPEMKVAESLTLATRGLPDIWNQLSVEILYQQSWEVSNKETVVLFDPVVEHGVDLEWSVVDEMLDSGLAIQEPGHAIYRFKKLPPHLYSRIFYDPDRGLGGQLVMGGELVRPLTGPPYLLLNFLNHNESADAKNAAAGISNVARQKWIAAVDKLPTAMTMIHPNRPFVHAALSSGLANGVGYVTVAFNNSTNHTQVSPSLPVSLSVFKVIPELYNAPLEPIAPADVLAEQFTMLVGNDFAGKIDDYDFQWRWAEPVGGIVPNTNYLTSGEWNPYGAYGDVKTGASVVNIEGASPFTLADHYFAVRYRLHDTACGPTGTNWSQWVYNLAPGWLSRVMQGINPYEQRVKDMADDPVNVNYTMVSMAGAPYEGPIALNMEYIDDYGLIQIYETVLQRAKSLSLNAGIDDPAINQAILDVVSRLNDLYMILGNEAYADAIDPTIVLGMGNNYYGYENYAAQDTGLFCFMNQEPNLLEETLALLRGRDDSLEPSVHLSPVFNRLIWNYTKGIDGGEVVYALNYDIKGDPTNLVPTITAADAKKRYPQGHGDAYGYYLSAIKGYYDLLTNDNFDWQTEPGAMLVGNADVSVDYFDERKFAETAAAKTRAGVDIVKNTYREKYKETTDNVWQDYRDSDTNRAWGVDGWASRVGQGAYFDWAVGNSILLYDLTNMMQVGGNNVPPEGIQKIDRLSTPELQEIASDADVIQDTVDDADAGINPLGLSVDAVPFDISPAEIDEGKTHFEQIYERALVALNNAKKAFDYAKGASIRLRMQDESVYSRVRELAQTELDYKNRLIEVFGKPYPDDIGPGKTYPQGYDGPDVINYKIVDVENLIDTDPRNVKSLETKIYRYDFTGTYNANFGDMREWSSDDWNPDNYVNYTLTHEITGTSTVWIADDCYQVKPPDWTSRRPVYGEMQLAMADYLKEYYKLKHSFEVYDDLMNKIVKHYHGLNDRAKRTITDWVWMEKNTYRQKDTSTTVEAFKHAKSVTELLAAGIDHLVSQSSGMVPKTSEGATGPFPSEQVQEDSGAALRTSSAAMKLAKDLSANAMDMIINGFEARQQRWNVDYSLLKSSDEFAVAMNRDKLEFEELVRQQYVKENELFAQVEAFSHAYENVKKTENKARMLMAQREQIRAQAAHRIQEDRYSDMAFRMFRDESLQKYSAAFNLAAKYVYLAAKAYDYETGLLDSDASGTSGSKFLTDIVKASSLGVIENGEPMVHSGNGDPGLADIMARMKGDWDVVKTRFGFNNPDTETSRFSLRTECFRISPSAKSDYTWQSMLQSFVVDDLNENEIYGQYCRPFTSSTEPQPAIVIPFKTTIRFGENFFGRKLAGGDNAYDSSHQATKIRSVGVWFSNYNNTYNTNSVGEGLSNEPRIYLVPAGEDIMRSPTGTHDQLRHWKVMDQVVPLPYNVGDADIDNVNWIPVVDSLTENIGQPRRYASLRAYHDSGIFVEDETHNNARLVGRSVWNSSWYLIIPGGTLLEDPQEGIARFIYGAEDASGNRDGNGVKDIKIFFQTYSISGE